MNNPGNRFLIFSYTIFIVAALLCNACFAQNRSLDYYVYAGIANSPLLKDYKNQVAANSIDSQRLRATYRPQVTATGTNAYYPVINRYGYDAALSNGANFTDVINVNQTFVSKKNITTQYSGIRLLSDSLRLAQMLTEQDLKKNIIAQYITAYGDLQQMNFYADVMNILKNQEVLLKRLTESNIYRQTDYLTFLVTMKQQQLQIKQLQIQYRNDLYLLNYLCGIFDTSYIMLTEPTVRLESLPDTSSSAFFMRFNTTHNMLTNQLKALEYSYKPKVSAFANAGYSSSLAYYAYKNFGTGVGINLSMPIYDGHQKTMQTKKIQLLDNTNDNYKDYFKNQYHQQITMLMQQLANSESLIADINEQIKYAERLIQVNSKLMETGDARIADLVIAINNYLVSKNLVTQNTISRMQIINQINYWNR